jgi:diguanylate cyclase (GGDEF)-like protein/PAS domain S-box-containing protein
MTDVGSQAPTSPTTPATASTGTGEPSGTRLLLVDDSDADAKALTASLKASAGHYRVEVVTCLLDALTRISAEDYECVLVELALPDAEGLEVIDALHEVAPETAIVVLTGWSDEALGVQAIRHGADDYLLKGEQSSRQIHRSIHCAIERTRARVLVQQLADKSSAIVSSLGDGLMTLDSDGHGMSINSAAAEIFGINPEDFIGTDVCSGGTSLVHRDGTLLREEERPALITLESGEPVTGAVVGVAREQAEIAWVDVSTFPLRGSGDRVTGVVISARDISARLVAEDTNQFQATLLAAVGQAVIVTDPQGRIVFWNPAAEALYGWNAAEALGREKDALLTTGDRSLPTRKTQDSVVSGESQTADLVVQRRDGSQFAALVTDTPMLQDDGGLAAVISVSVDITDRKRNELAAQALSAIVESTADAVFTKSLDGRILTWNRGAEHLYGFDASDVLGQHVSMLVPSDHDGEVRSILRAVAAGETVRDLDTVRRRRDGSRVDVSLTVSPIFDATGEVLAAAVIGRDISNRRALEHQLSRQAMHDALTGLPNRILLRDRLVQALAGAARRRKSLAVLLLDLDGFRRINDTNGHHVGDRVLVEVVRRLRQTLKPADTLARTGGDEFVVLCEETDVTSATDLAVRIQVALSPPMDLDGHRLYTPVSMGIVIPSLDETDPTGVLTHADLAMYAAKADRQGGWQLFEPAMAERSAERMDLSQELRNALGDDALELHYQPIVAIETGRLMGLEALLRWRRPDRGFVPPAVFVPVAEEFGLVVELDQWVLQRACRDAAVLRRQGLLPDDTRMSVNISAVDVCETNLHDRVLQVAASAGLPLNALELEVTETGLLADATTAGEVLAGLHSLGVGIALDDFGTGYSSLVNIRQLPVTTIKIDREFIKHVVDRSDDLAIAGSIVDLGRAVGVRTIAEGVETPEQLALLHRLGCTGGQGYLWSPALSRDEIVRLLASHPQGFGSADAKSRATAKALSRRATPRLSNEHGLHRIMRLHQDGASLATIAAALNADDYHTPHGSRWHSASVARAITNAVYDTDETAHREP